MWQTLQGSLTRLRSHLAVRLYGTPLLIARPKLDVILSVPGSRIGLPDLEENADSILASFRNDCHPRIAITVDMIATGTDVKPLEVLLFMRDVRSRDYYEQMKDHGITRSEDTLLPEEIEAARAQRVAAACAPFDNPALRDEIDNAHRERLIDHIKQHKDEIAAIGFFYQQPYQRRALTFDMLEDLHAYLARPPLILTTERLWSACARVLAIKSKAATANASSRTSCHCCALPSGWIPPLVRHSRLRGNDGVDETGADPHPARPPRSLGNQTTRPLRRTGQNPDQGLAEEIP